MTSMRMAWFSPFPPVRTGIAGRSAELVSRLRERGYEIDAFPEARAHDFPWLHRRTPYDLCVYQFGNSSHHDYEWPYALQYPGLAVLHDTHLHHARAALLLREKRIADYRAEFRWSHPDVSPDAAEIAVAGFDSALYYRWPMVLPLVAASRLTAVHGDGARRELVDALGAPNSQLPTSNSQGALGRIASIRLGEGELVSPEREARARRDVRAKYGIDDDAVLFGCFGGLTPEKRIPQILAAFRALLPHAPSARLLLAGAAAEHYDVAADTGRGRGDPDPRRGVRGSRGIEPGRGSRGSRGVEAGGGVRGIRGTEEDAITLIGYLETDDELTDHIAACDVTLNLRWPTARETSGPWLRALAAGRATVVTDLVHMTDVPSLDPRTWATNNVQLPTPNSQGALCVAIDVLDEDHSLRLAMRRLATDAALRERLGRAARDYWIREHSVDRMVDDYERVIRDAAARPAPAVDLPPHMRNPGDRHLRELLAPFGFAQGWPFETDTPI